MLLRIAFMADKKDVGEVYARLAGLKLQNVEPPMVVEFDTGNPTSTVLNLDGRKQITVKEIITQLEAAGKAKSAASYHITKLKEAGVLRPTAERGIYDIVQRNAKPNGKATKKKGSK